VAGRFRDSFQKDESHTENLPKIICGPEMLQKRVSEYRQRATTRKTGQPGAAHQNAVEGRFWTVVA